MIKGSCFCSAVAFDVSGEMRQPVSCHCVQCRKTSGHHWSATQVPDEQLTITKDSGLKWFRSSGWAQRGFCDQCGSSLFWKMDGEGTTSIGAGTLDGATGLKMQKHIYVADKGDYYDLTDGLPQLDQH